MANDWGPFEAVGRIAAQDVSARHRRGCLHRPLRCQGHFLIARNSSFICRGRALEAKQGGRDVDARSIWEGGARQSAGRVRITGRPIDAATGPEMHAGRGCGAGAARTAGAFPGDVRACGQPIARRPDREGPAIGEAGAPGCSDASDFDSCRVGDAWLGGRFGAEPTACKRPACRNGDCMTGESQGEWHFGSGSAIWMAGKGPANCPEGQDQRQVGKAAHAGRIKELRRGEVRSGEAQERAPARLPPL